jgi:hypothetical protein
LALTRAQLLAGNTADGDVLPNQPQGVIAGTGILIDTSGVISVDSSTITGLVRLNNPLGYNAYVWPQTSGAAGQFLQTSGPTGILTWAEAKGFAVVTVQGGAPSPADIGELWFDCNTGSLNVYQNCVGSPVPNWFNVAQSGLPVDPANTSALPPFTNAGSPTGGTQADPWDCTVTTTGAGTTVLVVNTVTITGLAPFQYVPIIDLNAITNEGRFSFSNFYANAAGQLIFQTIFKDQPPSAPGTTFTAAIKVGYGSAYIEAIVNVVTPLTLSAGSITGTPQVGTAVAYTAGTASGGTGGYTYTYEWFRDGVSIGPATSSSAYIPVPADVGKTLSVVQTVTDSSLATASATTTASSQTIYAPFPSGVWNPTGSMTSVPGGLSGGYTGTGSTITVTDCIESAVYTPPALPSYSTLSKPITSGQTLAVRWASSPACGDAPSPTNIIGSVSDGIYRNDYAVTVNRVPSPTISDITDTNVPLGGTVSKGIASPINGITATAYVTYDGASTGTTIRAATNAAGPWTTLATSGQGFPITSGQTLYIEQTVGSTIDTSPGYTAIIRVGDGTNTAGTYDEFTYFAQTVATATFPLFSPSPASGPNATPETVNFVDPILNQLNGYASGTWNDSSGVTITGNNMLLSTDGSTFTATITPNIADTVYFAWDPTYISGIADGDPATGDFSGTISAVTYTNAYTYTVDKDPAFTLPPPPPDPSATGASLSGTVNTGVLTVDEYNSPIDVTISSVTTVGALDLDNIAYEINGNGQIPVASLPVTFTLNPEDTVEFFGDTGALTLQEYGYTVTMGSATPQEWLVETVNIPPSIGTPTIDLPVNNATGINPGANGGVATIEGSVYDPQNGAGAQSASSFELYEAIPFNPETSAITNVASTQVGWDDISSSLTFPFNMTSISWTGGSAGDGCGLTAIEIDGVLLVGGAYAAGTSYTGTYFDGSPAGVFDGVITCPPTGLRGRPTGFTISFTPGTIPTANSKVRLLWTCEGSSSNSRVNGTTIRTGVINYWCVTPRVTLTLTNTTGLSDMVVGDTLTQDSAYAPVTSAITAVVSNPYAIFNGSNTSMRRALSASYTTFTISTWVYTNTSGQLQHIANINTGLANTRYLQLNLTTTNNVSVGYTDATVTTTISYASAAPIAVNTWNHVLLNSSASGTNLYVNGVLAGSSATPAYLNHTLSDFFVSKYRDGLPLPLNGRMRQFALVTGNALTPSSFISGSGAQISDAQVISNVGGFGTDGFFLDFSIASNLGKDAVGSNNLTLENMTSANQGADTNLTLTNTTDLYNFAVGNAVTESGGGSDATGTITAINSTSAPPTITLNPVTGTWNTGAAVTKAAPIGTGKISAIDSVSVPPTITLFPSSNFWGVGKYGIDTSRLITPAAPTTEPPDSTYYTATTGSPYSGTTPTPPTKPSVGIPQADLDYSKTYYTRVKYSTTTPSAIDSNFSNWSKFTTAATFFPYQPGDPVGGGYFAGQILVGVGEDGGGLPTTPTLYNLIVAPVLGDTGGPNPAGTLQGQYGGATPTGIQYKTTFTADLPATTSQNLVYGKPATDAFNDANHPLFQWCKSSFSGNNGPNTGGGIGGFTDWYIPAKNEFAILYFFLKPDTTVNLTTTGSNPNSVAPYTPNTNYGAGFPSITTADGTGGTADFRTGGAQDFSVAAYWSSSEWSGNPTVAWRQSFNSGLQNTSTKNNGVNYARAVRRVAA